MTAVATSPLMPAETPRKLSTITVPVKNNQEWPILPSGAAPPAGNVPAVFTGSKASTQVPSSPHSPAPGIRHSTTSSWVTSPVDSNLNAFPRTNDVSVMSSIHRFVCRSTLMTPFVMDRAAKAPIVLPPPIHLLYRRAAAQTQTALSHQGSCNDVLNSRSTSEAINAHVGTAAHTSVPESATTGSDMPQGDVYYLTWMSKEVAEMRQYQRGYERLQRLSRFAPHQVRPDELAANLMNDSEARGSEINGSVGSAAAASVVAGLCTRGIPQQEYLQCVFDHRVNVLQKRTKTIPMGVVVPAVVEPTQTLEEVVKSQRSDAAAARHSRAVLPLPTPEVKLPGPLTTPTSAAPTVTYPHPGAPFTYHDVVQNPLLLSAEQRADRRAALLHRRTLSEDIYGEPAAYL